MWLPNAEQVADLHGEIVHLFAGDDDPISPAGIKDKNLLESACFRPTTSLGSSDKYPSITQKLAALFHSLAKNHAFHNGNKRIALATLLTGLHRNDLRLRNTVTDEILYDFVLAVADDKFPSKEEAADNDKVATAIAKWISAHSEHVVHKFGAMRTTEFAKRCADAGALAEYRKGSYLISRGTKSIRIAGSTRQIDGPTIRKYLRILGLNANSAGFDNSEFRDGVTDERQQIYRFNTTMLRLAKT